MATHGEAFDAVMSAIKASAEKLEGLEINEVARASALRDLAAAYRHLRGGAQPGGVSVEK